MDGCKSLYPPSSRNMHLCQNRRTHRKPRNIIPAVFHKKCTWVLGLANKIGDRITVIPSQNSYGMVARYFFRIIIIRILSIFQILQILVVPLDGARNTSILADIIFDLQHKTGIFPGWDRVSQILDLLHIIIFGLTACNIPVPLFQDLVFHIGFVIRIYALWCGAAVPG